MEHELGMGSVFNMLIYEIRVSFPYYIPRNNNIAIIILNTYVHSSKLLLNCKYFDIYEKLILLFLFFSSKLYKDRIVEIVKVVDGIRIKILIDRCWRLYIFPLFSNETRHGVRRRRAIRLIPVTNARYLCEFVTR